jgi:hypothetical protein
MKIKKYWGKKLLIIFYYELIHSIDFNLYIYTYLRSKNFYCLTKN